MSELKIAYIAHEYGGDAANIIKVRNIIADIAMNDFNIIPYCPWLAYVESLDESIREHRARGLYMTLHLLHRSRVDELHLYANELSPGVVLEIHKAVTEKIPIKNLGTIQFQSIIDCLKMQSVDTTYLQIF